MKNRPAIEGLSREFFARPTKTVAKQLLGKVLYRSWSDSERDAVPRIHSHACSGGVGGIIVETEAYLSARDLASHSARGKTASNASMFMNPGTFYVYPIHANHCLNVVTETEGLGCAVLIRALEPRWGIECMQHSRGQTDLRKLTRGPGMICQAMAVDRSHDGVDLIQAENWVVGHWPELSSCKFKVRSTPRIGIRQAADLRLRFIVDQNRFVSGRAGDHSVKPSQSFLPHG